MGNLSTPKSVQKLQRALHAKAKAETGYRFYALYDKMYRKDILAHAYAQCRSNRGAPGVDGQNFADVEAYGVQRWLGELAFELRQETYRADPIRRVFIPKANGKLRPLGISTLRDRVCMTAAMLVLVYSSVHLTVMPVIDGVAFPALAKSGHQTLLPDAEGGAIWAENLGLKRASSAIADLFGEVLSLAGELGSMDCLGLGAKTRPEAEVLGRRRLEASFPEKRAELIRQLDTIDRDTYTDVFELVERLRSGDIDFAAEAQAALGGLSGDIAEAAGHLTLHLIEHEPQADAITAESKYNC